MSGRCMMELNWCWQTTKCRSLAGCALQILKQQGWKIPFILVSGVIGEEAAVAAMRNGATDYLMKDRLLRLSPAVDMALEQTRLRHERRLAKTALEDSKRRYLEMLKNVQAR